MKACEIFFKALTPIFYIGYFSGLVLIFGEETAALLGRIAAKKRFISGPVKKTLFSESSDFLNGLFFTATGKEVKGSGLLMLLLLLFSLSLIFSLRVLTFGGAAMLSVLLAAFPLLFLQLKAETMRSRASFEGLGLVSEIYRAYRVKDRNIYEALSAALDLKESYPTCARYLYTLLLRLRSAGSLEETERCVERFSKSLGTSWGHMLAVCIKLSAVKGTDVSEGLSDIVDLLKLASKKAEQRKRMNSESVRMALILVPLMYIGCFYLAWSYLGVPPMRFLRNQFLTPQGFMLFLGGSLLFIFNIILIKVTLGRRFDY